MRTTAEVTALVYIAGFIITFMFHALALQMVTPGLAFMRAAVWPVYVVTGWPHGTPVGMD